MSVIIPMNLTTATLFQGAAHGAAVPTKAYIAGRYRIVSQTDHSGTANAVARFNTAGGGSSGFSINMSAVSGSQRLAMFARSSVYNNSGTSASVTPGTWINYSLSYDVAQGFLRRCVNGGMLDTILDIGEAVWSGGYVPALLGHPIADRIIEHSHLYICRDGVLSQEEMEALDFATYDIEDLSDPPTAGYVPTGWNNTWANVIEDVIGSNDLILTAGATTEEAANRPYFVGPEKTLIFLSSSRGVNFFKPKMEITAEGTLYSVVGPASANTTDPTAQQIKEGKNQDETAALVADDFEITEPVAEQELQVSPLSPLTNYKWSAVLETVEDGLGNTIHQTFSTASAEWVDGPFYADIVTDNRIAGILQNICKRLNELEA